MVRLRPMLEQKYISENKNMKESLKKFKVSFLYIMAGVMVILAGWVIVYMITFLLTNLTGALSVEVKPNENVKFDTEGFEKLNLIKK